MKFATDFFAAGMADMMRRHGDIFVFKFPEDPQRDFIKRASGKPWFADTVFVITAEPAMLAAVVYGGQPLDLIGIEPPSVIGGRS